ncbi:MAG: response regulator transcription factor [Acidimicrobiales bacterium]|nr:response regulator transcription factor [Acidimicrobiales bacterium]
MLRRSRSSESHAGAGGGARAGVVVAGDDPDALELMGRLLTPLGEEVSLIGDTASAVGAVAARPCKVLVLAFSGPAQRTNLSALEALHRQSDPTVASTPVVVVADDEHHALDAWQAGIDDHLVRPVHADDLVGAVRGALERTEAQRADHRRQGLNRARAAALADPDDD